MPTEQDNSVGPPAGPASPGRWLLGIVWEAARGRRWPRVLFALGFITVAAFYFKDQRLAEEGKKAEPPAAARPVADPDDPLGGLGRVGDAELAKFGLRRIPRAEVANLILPGAVVVVKGRQDQKGFRVVYTEDDHAFVQSLVSGQYAAFHVAGLERKRVPDRMPPPKTD